MKSNLILVGLIKCVKSVLIILNSVLLMMISKFLVLSIVLHCCVDSSSDFSETLLTMFKAAPVIFQVYRLHQNVDSDLVCRNNAVRIDKDFFILVIIKFSSAGYSSGL